MKKIINFEELQLNDNFWLLLFKQGLAQNDNTCENFTKAGQKSDNSVLCFSEVNEVNNIHAKNNITSVPALLNFKKGQLENIVKGYHQPEQFNVIFEKVTFTTLSKENMKTHL